jgi:SAM-dependent methyltransferase
MPRVNWLQRIVNSIRVYRRLTRGISGLETVSNLDSFLRKSLADHKSPLLSFSLDLGCGPQPQNPFGAHKVHGVDLVENASTGVFAADLTISPIPFEGETFDFITAFDFLEHVPRVVYLPERRFPFVELMNEVWRVLKPGGLFMSHTPAYPFVEAFQDPTHVNFITANTFTDYFSNSRRGALIYGFNGSFAVRSQAMKGSHLLSLLEKTSL